MKTKLITLYCFILHSSFCLSLHAQLSASTYQGQLKLNGAPANGIYDFMFRLLNDPATGVAAPVIPINLAVPVSNGLFTTGMDFGAENFGGANLWLEVNVRTNGGGGFTTLSPRQLLTSAPYAVRATSASNLLGTLPAAQISGTIAPANIGAGTISGAMLVNGAVGSTQLAAGAVTTAALADGAVTAGKMLSGSNWFALTIPNPAPADFDIFGNRVAAMGGDRILIAAQGDDTGADSAGVVHLFSTDGRLLTTFANPSPALGDLFGNALAAVGSDRVLIGVANDDTGANDAGAAYLFSTNGALVTTFTNPTPVLDDDFGISVAAVRSDRVLIGASGDDTGALNAGTVYLFGTNGTLITTFANPTPAANEFFGRALAVVAGDRVLIGATGDDTGANNAGVAYLFSTDATLITTFTNPAPASDDSFGDSVAGLGSDRVLISAPNDLPFATNAGAVYLFNTNGTLIMTFTNPAPPFSDSFGRSVAGMGSDYVLIGAFSDDTGANNAGVAYLFSTNGSLIATLTNPTPVSSDSFGISVAVVGNNQVLIGASQDGTGAVQAGAAYLFSMESFLPNVVADEVRPRSITAASLDDGAVTVAKLAVGAVTSTTIADGTIVNADISATANIADTKLATISAAGKVANSATTATSTNVPNTIVARDSSGAISADLRAPVGIGTTSPVADLHVNGPIVIQGTLSPGSTSSSNLLNLMVGGNTSPVATNGSLNGISFYEGAAAKAMSLGYDGSGGSSQNALRIYHSSDAVLFTFEASGDLGIGTNSPSERLHVIGDILASGTITPNSDRNAKTDIEPVNAKDVLNKVAALPIAQWRFKTEEAGVRHIGPMAQDFHSAFGLGERKTAIATVDADGVALAAIQGLNQKLEIGSQKSDNRIQKLEAENTELKRELAELTILVKSMNQQLNGAAK